MPSRTLPGLGLKGDWDLGEDGWKPEMDSNLIILSALVQPRVLDILDADPGAPVDGQIYYFSAIHPTNADKIAIRDEGAWIYIPAFEGLKLYNIADDTNYEFNGIGLVSTVPSAATIKYRVGFSIEGTAPVGGEVLLRHAFQTDVDFADDFAGSVVRVEPAGGNPATDQDFDVILEGASIGTITLASTGVITMVTTAGILSALQGEELRVEAPAAPDTAIIGMSFTLSGIEA